MGSGERSSWNGFQILISITEKVPACLTGSPEVGEVRAPPDLSRLPFFPASPWGGLRLRPMPTDLCTQPQPELALTPGHFAERKL